MLVLYLSDRYLLGMAIWLIILGGLFYGLLRYRQVCRKASRRRSFVLVNAGLSLAMLLAVVTSAELAFACFADFSDTFNVTNVSKRWLALHVDAEKNNEGFRDRIPFTKYVSRGKKRIFFLGDSFTAGHGIKKIDDRFTDRIAAWLDEKAPGKYIVANQAQPGFEVSMVAATARALFVVGADVSTVVYVFNLNDIEGYDPHMQEMLGQIYTAEPTFPLFRDTYLLNWLYFRFVQLKQTSSNGYFTALAESYRSKAWDGLRAKLSEMHRDCVQGHADLRIVIFPFMQDLGPNYPFREADAKLVEFCKSEKIPVLDLEPVFREHARENLVVSRFDAHPNERANAIAAEAIEKDLLSDLVQPAQP